MTRLDCLLHRECTAIMPAVVNALRGVLGGRLGYITDRELEGLWTLFIRQKALRSSIALDVESVDTVDVHRVVQFNEWLGDTIIGEIGTNYALLTKTI